MSVVRFPMQPFPTSWYRIADSSDIHAEKLTRLQYFGRELVGYRTCDGRAHVADAYCPHLGAHLGAGGSLHEDRLQCPFHGWQFASDGRCVEIPYTKKIPSRARLRTYPAFEQDGVIAVFYDEQNQNPAWSVPPLDEAAVETWTPFARKTWRIRTHVQEIVENGPDAAHQITVHNAVDVPEISCTADEQAYVTDMPGRYEHPGAPLGGIAVSGRFVNYGLGFTHMQMSDTFGGRRMIRQVQFCWTPVDDEYVEASIAQRISDLGDEEVTNKALSALVHATWSDFEQDIPIWENKIYRSLPTREKFNRGESPNVLCESEGEIVKFRKWARQFYNSQECAV